MARRGAQLQGPVGPGQRLVFLFRRLGHDFKLGDAGRALPVRRADTVAPGVAAADHHHVLAGGRQAAARCGAQFIIAGHALVLLGQEFHREAHAGHFCARNIELARFFRAACQHHRIVILRQRLEGDIDAHFLGGFEGHPFGFHLDAASVDKVLFHLEIRNAVTKEPAHAVGLFEHGDAVPGACQLLRTSHARRARANHRDLLAGLLFRDLRLDPAFLPPAIDDGTFDRFDRDRLIDDVERAGCLAGGGADAARKFGEIVGGMQHGERVFPVPFIDQMVPVGDDVVHRTAIVAVGNAAIHAARGLRLQGRIIRLDDKFAVILQPLFRVEIVPLAAIQLKKSGFLAHVTLPSFHSSLRGAECPVAIQTCAVPLWIASPAARNDETITTTLLLRSPPVRVPLRELSAPWHNRAASL